MFVILNAVKTDKQRIRRGKTILSVRSHNLQNRDKFFVVDVSESKNGINWRELEDFLGVHSSGVLLTDSCYPPSSSAIKRFDSTNFLNLLLFNTVSVIIKNIYFSGLRVKCYINDPRGDFAFLLPDIVRYASQTVVVTRREYKYHACVQAIFDDMGAAVTVTSKTKTPPCDAIVIDTDGSFFCPNLMNFNLFGGIVPAETEGFELLKSFCPDYIEQNDFLAAVYEKTRCKNDLAQAFCSHMYMSGVKIPLSELVHIAKQKISNETKREKSIIFYV